MVALAVIVLILIVVFVIKYIIQNDKPKSNNNIYGKTEYRYTSSSINDNKKTDDAKVSVTNFNYNELVSDEIKHELDNYLNYLLPKINYWYLGNFSFPEDVINKLDNNPSEEYINSLVKIVLKSTNTNIGNLKVICDSIKENQNYVGLYKKEFNDESITVTTSPTNLAEKYIAIILHECAHKILGGLNIGYKNTNEDEKLTDISTLILGLIDYNAEGYLYGIGYLKYPELMYCKERIEREFKERWEMLQQEIQTKIYEITSYLNFIKQKTNNLELFQKPKDLSYSDFVFLQNIQNGKIDDYIFNLSLKFNNIVENNILEKHLNKLQQYLENTKNIHRFIIRN